MGVKRILIVEDELITAMVLRLELSECGYDVIDVVSSGASAIIASIEKHPDLILMDIFLNDDVDGIVATEEIHKTVKIPVIYLTASDDSETHERVGETDFAAIIHKPYFISNLKLKIEEIFSSEESI